MPELIDGELRHEIVACNATGARVRVSGCHDLEARVSLIFDERSLEVDGATAVVLSRKDAEALGYMLIRAAARGMEDKSGF